jgi:hypothetical protein
MVVNRSTMYLVPVVVPTMEELLPVNDVRPPVDADVFVTATLTDCADALRFPYGSLNDPAATVTTPVPPDARAAV